MKRVPFLIPILLAIVFVENTPAASPRILIFAGAAGKPATEEGAQIFKEKFGIRVDMVFGGSGFVLSQMKLAKKGDLYFPGSSDFMEKAKREGLVFPESERILAYLIPVISVQKGNPKKIYSLKDLTRDGIRVAIANPEMVCVGTYAAEVIEKNLNSTQKERLRKNLVNYTESCEKTANVISLKAADAVLGWDVFQHWDPERIETIYLSSEEIPRVGYIPIAISGFTKEKKMAQKFIDFLLSPDGKAIFRKYHYMTDIRETQRFTKHDAPVGGEYILPHGWRTVKK